MAKSNLVIVESPAKAKTIGKYLGPGYEVKASMGHVRDLPKSKLGVDVEHGFELNYQPIKGKEEVIDELKKSAKKSEKVFLATDPDREGEAISWHLKEMLGIPDDKTYRVTFNEITKKVVNDSIAHPRAIDMDLVNAQQARRVLDRIVGYQISPLLWKKIRRGLSAGRVQSVATRLVCEREADIKAFVPQEYWSLDADLSRIAPNLGQFKASFYGREKKVELNSEAEVNAVMEAVKNAPFAVTGVKRQDKQRNPAPPFITSTLQQEASRKLNMTPRRTMSIAQQLYEGVDIEGEGTVGLITYMRTDSLRLSDEATAAAKDFILARYGADYYPGKARVYKTKSGAQDAHEAIRPSNVNLTPEDIKKSLTAEQYKLYKLIWSRFLACQMAPAVYDSVSIEVTSAGYTFRATHSALKFSGYTAVYVEGKDEEEEAFQSPLPDLKEGEALKLEALKPDQHFTQPPSRYTEATLVKTLEAKEIGRPSTYASIISTIMDRGYVYERGRALIPSWLAFSVTKLLETNFPKLVDYQFTAEMENGLDRIAHGEESGRDWLTHFYFGSGEGAARNADEAHEGLQQQVAQLGEIDARAINTIDIGDGLHVRVGRYGPYLEDMEHLDAEGNPKRASLPDTIAPDELTVAVARDLIDNHSGGPRELGVDPVSGGTVEVRNGRFGPYVALVPPAEASAGAAGDTAGASAAKKGSKKAAAAAASRPKMASLFKTMSPESLSLEDALKLLSLPREVGTYEETNAETGEVSECTVAANNGRYGPYLTKTGADGKSETRSLASEDEIFTVDIDKAKELFSQPKYGRGRGRGAAKPPLRDLGKDPNTGKNVTIKDGRFGAYITDGETNRTVPRQYTPESITPDDAFRLLAEKRAAGPSTRGRRGAGRAGGAKAVAGKGKKGGTSAAVSAQEAKRAERRAEVKKLANKGWSNQRIAEKLGSTPATVKKDVDWLTANEGYERPAVIPKRG